MKKRMMTLALAVVMALGVAGCGGEKEAENNTVTENTATDADTKTVIQAQMPAECE
ncbi:MAG: hypothetical protein IJE57_04070 [Anaerotignum sp.]|nr:hypothetical protein [Anaerotignum sp.]